MDAIVGPNNQSLKPKSLALLAVEKIRKKSLERGAIQNWLNDDIFLHQMLYLLRCHGKPEIQMEAAWFFTNIAAGSYDQTKLIVDRGVIPLTVNLLTSPSDEVVEQAIWTLGNIIGDNAEFRDMVIAHGLIDLLLAMDPAEKYIAFNRTYIWVIVNLVRCQDPQISLENVKTLVPRINLMLLGLDNVVKIDALWALTYIADCGVDYIQTIIDSTIIQSIVPLLSSNRYLVMLGAMRMLGNVATGSDAQTDVLILNGILVHIRLPLTHHKDSIRRMALWCLSNITVGTPQQVQAVFQSGLLARIIESLQQRNISTRKEALFTVGNLIVGGTKEQSLDLINAGAVKPLYDLTFVSDISVNQMARTALQNLFRKANRLIERYTYDRVIRSQ